MKLIQSKDFFSESKVLLMLTFPLLMSGLIESSIGFFSNIFLAHLGGGNLAAAALVNWSFAALMVIIWGIFSSINIIIARYHGAKKDAEICHVFYAGLVLAIFLMLPTMLLLWNLAPIFLFLGQTAKKVKLAQYYLHALTWSIVPNFIITVFLQFVAGLGRTKINLIFSFLFVSLNIFFNYSLVFGKFDFPKLGISGIGWGTAITFWITAFGFSLYFYLNKNYHIYFKLSCWKKIISHLYQIFHIGFSLGLSYFFEISFFLIMSLLMGHVNTNTLSANQIALQFFGLFSIITFAISQGITIRVGHSVGQKNKKGVNHATYIGIFYASVFMVLVALIYWVYPEKLIGMDFNVNNVNNKIIVHLAKEFLALAAFVQFFEASCLGLLGALRGLKDTRFTLFIVVLIFWVIALPFGDLALSYGFKGGIWFSMILGEIIGIYLLISHYHRKVNESV